MTRRTAQREAIQMVFEHHPRLLRINEIIAYGREWVPTLDLATVYRNLSRLEQEGWLVRFVHPELGTVFEQRRSDHHHHFHCRICDRIFIVYGCAIAENDALPEGFVAEDHLVFFQGRCAECNSGPTGRGAKPKPRSAARQTRKLPVLNQSIKPQHSGKAKKDRGL
jgi:Fur family transcriptional regulator, ferric uptake regulator